MRSSDDMRYGLVISASLHIGLFLIIYFGLPSLFKPLPTPWTPVPIDIVDIGEITNTRVGSKPEKTVKPPMPPQPKAPEAPKPPPEPQSKPEPQPKPPEPEPKPDEESPVPTPKPKVKPKPPEPKKEEAKPVNPLASVLKNVANLKPSAPPPVPASEPDAKAEPGQGQGPSLSDRLTISEEDALRRQISQCWNMPVGARDAEELIVEVLIQVNPDRTVQSAQVVDQARAASDPFFRAAAEAALRALRSPLCSPLALPPDKYDQWKTIHFTFDPRDML